MQRGNSKVKGDRKMELGREKRDRKKESGRMVRHISRMKTPKEK